MTDRTVVFVCEHGAAKSVIAAAYLPQLAEPLGIGVHALARGTDPEPTILEAAATGLHAAGLPVPLDSPRQAAADELGSAWAVVSFGPHIADAVPPDGRYLRWTDVPAVSDNFEAARDAIVAHVSQLLTHM